MSRESQRGLPQPDTAAAGEMFGKYELVQPLGRGGMAEVWKAKIRGVAGFERTLVIKRVLAHIADDNDFVGMFVREAQLCSMLNHPNIVQVYELGEISGEYYIAMEYVNGRDLHSIMHRWAPQAMPAGLAAFIGRDIARALAYANELPGPNGEPLRLVHRDVTPSNMMLTLEGTVKLVDFGIAKALTAASMYKTMTGAVKGKLAYMAPEQLRGEGMDCRCDIFAVGATLYELVVAQRLFKGETDEETINKVLRSVVVDPTTLNPAVPKMLSSVIMKALRRDPNERYQTAAELADALDACVHELKWGPSQTKALLRERLGAEFGAELGVGGTPSVSLGSLVPLTGSMTAHEDVTPPQPLPKGTQAGKSKRQEIPMVPDTMPSVSQPSMTPSQPRPAPFVHSIDAMGSWTGQFAETSLAAEIIANEPTRHKKLSDITQQRLAFGAPPSASIPLSRYMLVGAALLFIGALFALRAKESSTVEPTASPTVESMKTPVATPVVTPVATPVVTPIWPSAAATAHGASPTTIEPAQPIAPSELAPVHHVVTKRIVRSRPVATPESPPAGTPTSTPTPTPTKEKSKTGDLKRGQVFDPF